MLHVMVDLNSKMNMAINKVRISSDVELKDKLVAINRVTKVTKGGRTFTFAAIVAHESFSKSLIYTSPVDSNVTYPLNVNGWSFVPV